MRNETAPLWLAVPKCPIRDVPDAIFPLSLSLFLSLSFSVSLAEATDDKKMAPGRNQLIHTPHPSVAYNPIDNGPTDSTNSRYSLTQRGSEGLHALLESGNLAIPTTGPLSAGRRRLYSTHFPRIRIS